MKKQIIFFAIILFAVIASSCGNRYASRTVSLHNMTDSINYALGFANGDAIRQFYMQNVDNEDAAIRALIEALDKAFNSATEPDEMYELGIQIGMWLRQMENDGLMGEPELVANTQIIRRGMEMGMRGTAETWTAEDAQNFVDMVLLQMEEERMRAMFNFDINELLNEGIIELE